MSNNRKRWIVLIVLAIVILFGFDQLVRPSKHTVTITQKESVPATLAASAAFGDNSLVTGNGQTLVSYNYITGQISDLAGVTSLGPIDTLSVSANSEYILFHDNGANANTPLAAALTQANIGPQPGGYWWIFSVQQKTFTPLSGNPLAAKFTGNDVYGMTYSGTSASIVTYNLQTGQPTKSISVIPSADFFVANNNYLLEDTKAQIIETPDGIVNTRLFTATTMVGVSGDQRWLLATQTKGSNATLLQIDLHTDTPSTIATNTVGNPVWLNGDTILYAVNDNQGSQSSTANYFTYNLTTQKTTQFIFTASSKPSSGTTDTPVALLGIDTAIFSENNNYYLVGNKLHSVPTNSLSVQ